MNTTSKLQKISEELSGLTILEASELTKILEEKWGVSASAMMAPVMAAPAGAAPVVEEQTEFNVILKDAGANKINVIKEIRAITSLGLKEAKDFVDGAPVTVKDGISKEDATKIKNQLEAAGAKVTIE